VRLLAVGISPVQTVEQSAVLPAAASALESGRPPVGADPAEREV
jgi:hypothetical protein